MAKLLVNKESKSFDDNFIFKIIQLFRHMIEFGSITSMHDKVVLINLLLFSVFIC
jgi:hypothetical protein